jgi:uncharacterized protein YbjQ (UPF0145 family)
VRGLRAVVVFGLCLVAHVGFAQTKTIALYVDGPDAARVREAVIPVVGVSAEVAGDKVFRTELARAGQKKPFGATLDGASIHRIQTAARAIGADAVVVLRVRRDRTARRVIVLVVDVSEGPSPATTVPLDLRSHEADADEIAAALREPLERYAPRPEPPPPPAPAPSIPARAETPPAPPVVSERDAADARDATPAHRAATSILDMAFCAEAVGRHFAYADGISGKTKVYDLFPALGLGARAKLFPLAHFGRPWADIGIVGDGSLTILQSHDLRGALSNMIPVSYSVGPIARIHPGASERLVFGVSVGYAVTSFGSVGPPSSELPDVTYRSLRFAADGRATFGRFSLVAGAAFRALLDPDGISTRFYGPRGFGFDAEAGMTFMVVRNLEARLAARYEQYGVSFHPPPGATFSAGHATDELYGVGASIALLF